MGAKLLRPVLLVVQLMGDISKQDCMHNKRIPQCTKMRICTAVNEFYRIKQNVIPVHQGLWIVRD